MTKIIGVVVISIMIIAISRVIWYAMNKWEIGNLDK